MQSKSISYKNMLMNWPIKLFWRPFCEHFSCTWIIDIKHFLSLIKLKIKQIDLVMRFSASLCYWLRNPIFFYYLIVFLIFIIYHLLIGSAAQLISVLQERRVDISIKFVIIEVLITYVVIYCNIYCIKQSIFFNWMKSLLGRKMKCAGRFSEGKLCSCEGMK